MAVLRPLPTPSNRLRPFVCGGTEGTARALRRFSDVQQRSSTGVPSKGLYCEIPWPKNSPVRNVPLNRSFIRTFQRTTNTSHAARAAQSWRPYRSSGSSSNVTSCLRGRPLAAADVQSRSVSPNPLTPLHPHGASSLDTQPMGRTSAIGAEGAITKPGCSLLRPRLAVRLRRARTACATRPWRASVCGDAPAKDWRLRG
jgi:hypothetical protein